MEASVNTKKDSLNDFFVTKCPSMKKLKKRMSEVNLDNKPAVAAIVLIMAYFKEDEEVFLRGFEVSQKLWSILCNKLHGTYTVKGAYNSHFRKSLLICNT